MVAGIVIFLLLVGLGFSLWANFNAIKKIEHYEEYSSEMESWILKFQSKVEEANIKLIQIDHKGSFESDDEVGFFFKDLKQLSRDLMALVEEKDLGDE